MVLLEHSVNHSYIYRKPTKIFQRLCEKQKQTKKQLKTTKNRTSQIAWTKGPETIYNEKRAMGFPIFTIRKQ